MILLLENNTIRANKSEINFENYSEVMESVFSDVECNTLLADFLEDNHVFYKYKTIIIHESIYREEQRKELFKTLESYAKNKNLVKFSGNNSQASLTDKTLQLSAENLYENLETFLQESQKNESNILMLAYGKYWDLNKLLNTLQLLNLFIEDYDEKEEIDFDVFEDDFDLRELKNILSDDDCKKLFKNLDNFEDEIDLEQIKVLAHNFEILIQEKSNG